MVITTECSQIFVFSSHTCAVVVQKGVFVQYVVLITRCGLDMWFQHYRINRHLIVFVQFMLVSVSCFGMLVNEKHDTKKKCYVNI